MSWEMIQIFHIQIVCEFRLFNKKLITFKFLHHKKKIYYLKLLFSFLTFFRLSHTYILCWELISWKKVFLLFVCFPLQKKLDRSSYDVTMTHYDVLLILFLFRFVANVQDLEWDNFLVLNMKRGGIIRIYLPGKNDPPQTYAGVK